VLFPFASVLERIGIQAGFFIVLIEALEVKTAALPRFLLGCAVVGKTGLGGRVVWGGTGRTGQISVRESRTKPDTVVYVTEPLCARVAKTLYGMCI
jgi:hypothetical protein